MSNPVSRFLNIMWKAFRRLPIPFKWLFAFPTAVAVALALIVGNMGLAFMGTAVTINALIAGWLGGFIILVLTKAGFIIVKDSEGRK